MRYWKVLMWTAIGVILLTAAQYGCVHLLNQRPSSWLFEASLDVAPPLLFAGDIVQLSFTGDSQAPLRDQLHAVAAGVMVNIGLYAVMALWVTWLFFPPKRPRGLNAEKQKK